MKNNLENRKINKLKVVITLLVIILIILLIIKHNSLKQTYESNIASNEDITAVTDNIEEETNEVEIEEQEDSTFTMVLTGDIMCHNSMYTDAYNSSKDTYDFSYMFEDIKDYIQKADIAIGNLETTFAGKERGYSNYPNFNTPEQLATNLKETGFDILSTANNHCMDTGYTGLVSTLNYLDEAGIAHTGTYQTKEDSQEILVKEVNGINIAFLSFTYGTNGITIAEDKSFSVNLIDEDLILEQIGLAKKQNVDMICVSMHWGTEYQDSPNSTQEELADFLFENGVDIIIGNHPHVLQTMEKRVIELDDGTTKDGFVVYSLGNFMANQNSEYTKSSAILNLQITKNADTGNITIDSVTYIPTYYYKNTNKSSQKFKILDVENVIENYEDGSDTSIGKTAYDTLVSALKHVKEILGDEI